MLERLPNWQTIIYSKQSAFSPFFPYLKMENFFGATQTIPNNKNGFCNCICISSR